MKIHPLTVVSPEAELGRDVVIGPFCVIEPGVRIGDGCQLASGVVIKSGTTLGPHNIIGEHAVLGALPQHIQCPQEIGTLEVGSGNSIREHVTIHRALHAGHATMVGSDCLLMACTHVAHDCVIGDRVIMANNALLGGHVTVGDRAFVSAAAAVHQYCRIGRFAMVGGQAHITQDVLPYVLVDGRTSMLVGLNRVGLRRSGFDDADMLQLKQAYRLIFRSGLKMQEIIARLREEFPGGPAANYADFLATSKRGIVQDRRDPPPTTIKLRPAISDETLTPVRKVAG